MKKPEQTLVIDTETSTEPATFVTANTTETITIKKSQLDELMDRLKRVEFAAEKSRLARFDENNKGGKGKVVRLRTIEGKVVISWEDMISNTVEKNSRTGAWGEDQKIRINLEDKTSKDMDLVVFNRYFVHLEADVISETKLQGTNDIIFKVRTEDGREYEINNKFIN